MCLNYARRKMVPCRSNYQRDAFDAHGLIIFRFIADIDWNNLQQTRGECISFMTYRYGSTYQYMEICNMRRPPSLPGSSVFRGITLSMRRRPFDYGDAHLRTQYRHASCSAQRKWTSRHFILWRSGVPLIGGMVFRHFQTYSIAIAHRNNSFA